MWIDFCIVYGSFPLQWQKVGATATIWLAKSEIFTTWPLIEYAFQFLLYSNVLHVYCKVQLSESFFSFQILSGHLAIGIYLDLISHGHATCKQALPKYSHSWLFLSHKNVAAVPSGLRKAEYSRVGHRWESNYSHSFCSLSLHFLLCKMSALD